MKPNKLELLQEANRRGILPPNKKELYDEAVNRGLISNDSKSEKNVAEEIVRPLFRTAKDIAVGTLGSAGDLAQQAVYAPEALGRTVARKVGLDVEPFDYSKVNTVSPMIREGFDEITGGLTTPRNKTEELSDTIGEIGGGIIGPGAIKNVAQKTADVASFITKRGLQKLGGIANNAKDLIKAFEVSGVNPTLANIAEGQTTKTFQNLLGNTPGSRGIIEKAVQNQVDNITKQISGIAGSEGGTTQQTGKTIQEGAKNLQTLAAKRADKLYGDLDKFIPKNAVGENAAIPTSNFANAINTPEIQDVAAVKGGTIQGLINRYAKLSENGEIPYDRAKIFRGTIGKESYSNSLSGSEKSAAKQLYGALSEDMKAAIVAGGGNRGLEAFNKANNAFHRHLGILDTKINPLVEAKTPEAVYGMALSGSKQGGSNVKIIMKSLDPEQQDFVRGTIARKMGSASAGEQDAAGEVFSPNRFLTEWNKLSPEARSNIFTKDQTQAFGKLNEVIKTIKDTSKARQTSNNLPYATWAGLGGLTAANPAAGLGVVAVSNITSRMMTNPTFIRWLAKTPKVRQAEIPRHLKALSTIAASNSDIRNDILDYLESITLEADDNKRK